MHTLGTFIMYASVDFVKRTSGLMVENVYLIIVAVYEAGTEGTGCHYPVCLKYFNSALLIDIQ